MRKLVSGLFISLDGVVQSPDQWQEHFDEDMGASLDENIARTDAILLGRVTYQEWKDYWPNAEYDDAFKNHINNTPKYVVSTTLTSVEWGGYDTVTLLKDDPFAAIARFKEQPGKDISIAGSPTLVRSLLERDLIDELTLLIHPVVAGKGKHLFHDGDPLKRMRVLSSSTSRTGTLIVTYEPVKAAGG